jgi:dTDP-4-dehydrorhamnose 3,5-epimerase
MKFQPTAISGAFLIELEPKTDDRGSFARSFCGREFASHEIDFKTAQCNIAHTHQAGTVRGLHYFAKPAGEQKLVRCIAGEVFDVIVDMRDHSVTYRQVFTTRLSAANRLSLFIPAGVAHGYQTLSNDTTFFYMTDEFYVAGYEKGVRFDDPSLSVSWPLSPINVTDRDKCWPSLPPV